MSSNLAVFALTADQRYLLGADVFLRTHYPITTHRYNARGEVKLVGENALLQQMLNGAECGPGNRLWVLYGAPGSGKSELVKWLETRIGQDDPRRAAITVRISRNELDALSVVNRFLHLLPDRFLSETTAQRWQAARQKSRTLAKIILLFALESLLDSDEIINALFYRLLNALQPYVDDILKVDGNELASVDLIGQETWDAIINETALMVPLDYEQFRHQLTIAFRDHLLEGISLANTMRRISEFFTQNQGIRPILLVDDLVQSLNVFATDILDYLLTLEAGNWDVVIGLTPSAFEDSQRGRTLLQRIAYLDTIDDRVEKLWLSDEMGQDSYILTEQNCHEFAGYYLTEYHSGQITPSRLYPFNREVLVRIYRGLPTGKGKVRYFVRYLHDVLIRVSQGEDTLSVLIEFAQTEYVARVDDKRLARVCELYGPLLDGQDITEVTLPIELMRSFDLPQQDVKITIEPLGFHWQRESTIQMVDDEGKKAIRDWLLNKPVNRQLLKGLRQGAARWLRAIQPPNWLFRDHIARPKGILRWQGTYLNTHPPICLEGVDDVEGIVLTREIGLLAFDLYRYATAKGDEAKKINAQLAQEPKLISLQFAAMSYHQKLLERLTEQIGMDVESLALSLYVFLLFIDDTVDYRSPGFTEEFWIEIENGRSHRAAWKYQIDEKILDAIQYFFTDFFRLRENLFDGGRINCLVNDRLPESMLTSLNQIDVTQIDKDYHLGRMPLSDVLIIVQKIVRQWQCQDEDQRSFSQNTTAVLQRLLAKNRSAVPLSEVPMETWGELKAISPEIYANLRVSLQD